ncbi:MAG: YciI family protein [Thermomicrobiales bacterium]
MKYMLLLYNTSDNMKLESPSENMGAIMAAHREFAATMIARGGEFYGEPLHDPQTARSLRPNGTGELIASDGPFVEIKEFIGGYYVFEAESMDDAVEVGRTCPTHSGIEIRQIVDLPGLRQG